MLGLVLLQGRVEVVAPPIVDEEAANVGLGLGAQDLGNHLEILAEFAHAWRKEECERINSQYEPRGYHLRLLRSVYVVFCLLPAVFYNSFSRSNY